MGCAGLATALLDEGEDGQCAGATHRVCDDEARVDRTLVTLRLKALLDATRLYGTAAARPHHRPVDCDLGDHWYSHQR
ncbi:hypothetical protein AB0B01_17115 [Streptomyces sp. NPDC044571]|uniref:hypothetical protein n=1 Tax=Streptomyces sp. NPDC044571 TaxID=3155371 RepID=UPI0033E4DCB6